MSEYKTKDGVDLFPRIPCGQTLGHGESCCEGHLCDSCQEIVALRTVHRDLDQLLNILANKEAWEFSHRKAIVTQRPPVFPEVLPVPEAKTSDVYRATVMFATGELTPWDHFAQVRADIKKEVT